MKARIERERIPPSEDPRFHLKLGRGSLSDVEFTVQLLQLQHGARHPEIRVTSTIEALHQLRAFGLLDPGDADALEEAYRFCERARNAQYLLTGRPGDALPTDGTFGGGQGEAAYKSFLVEAFAKQTVKAGGLGLSPAIQHEILRLQGAA